ncbi:MAG: DinB family protein [Dehalococcoidia bacterium]|nr:DinB family protein [Dehalococcoidia bacterium]
MDCHKIGRPELGQSHLAKRFAIPDSEDQMTLNEFIEDALNTEHEYLMDALSDITSEELMWRAGPEANPIGWILWHMIRVEDMWFQFFIQRENEIWAREGWNEKFGLPARDNGFEHTPDQVAAFPAYDLASMLQYGEDVRTATLNYLNTVTEEQMDIVPREARPEMSIGRIFRQVVGEVYQHQGHIAYLKGLQRSGK